MCSLYSDHKSEQITVCRFWKDWATCETSIKSFTVMLNQATSSSTAEEKSRFVILGFRGNWLTLWLILLLEPGVTCRWVSAPHIFITFSIRRLLLVFVFLMFFIAWTVTRHPLFNSKRRLVSGIVSGGNGHWYVPDPSARSQYFSLHVRSQVYWRSW